MRRPGARVAAALLGAALGLALSGCPETLDFRTGRFYACSPDGGPDQCATGWRCGLEGYCHPAIGAAWLCGDDGDCDGVWRCGTEGWCVNPTADALVSRGWTAPALEPVSPRFVQGSIEVAAASAQTALMDRCDFPGPANNYPFCGERLDESIAFASSGKLVQAMRLQRTLDRFAPGSDPGIEYSLPDGGRPPLEALTWAPLSFTPQAIAVHRFETYVLDPGGRLHLMTASLDGGQSAVQRAPFDVPAPFAPNALRVERVNYVSNSPILVAYERGGDELAVYSLEDRSSSGALALPPSITGGAILDLSLWDAPASLVLTTDAGIFLANRGSDGFILRDGGSDLLRPDFLAMPALWQLPDGGIATLQQAGMKPVRTWVFPRPTLNPNYTYMLVESVRPSPSGPIRRVTEGGWDYSTSPSGYQIDPPLDAVDCDPGDVVAAVEVHDLGTDEELEVICRQPGGARPDVLKRVRGTFGCRLGCQVTEVHPDAGRGLQMLSSGYNRTGHLDLHGRIFFDEYGVGQNTLTLDRAPVAVVGGRGSLEAWAVSDRLAPLATTEHFVEGGAGLVQALGADWYRPPRVGGVRGQSHWRIEDRSPAPVVTARQDGGTAVLFSLPALSDLRQGPFEGEAQLIDGRLGVVISAFDTILSGQLGRDRELQVRVVPNPRAAITSFDLQVMPPDAGVLLDGYAIAQARLFRITAETGLRWLSSEVAFNVRGEPRKVWLDQGRGRVAFADGRVFSLPSRVLLAPQLPELPPQASDFAFTCGHAFALGRRGLWRLDSSSGGNVGTWTAVDLDAVVPGAAADPGWEGGALHAVSEPGESALYVLTAHGSVVRLSFDPASCP